MMITARDMTSQLTRDHKKSPKRLDTLHIVNVFITLRDKKTGLRKQRVGGGMELYNRENTFNINQTDIAA